LNLKFNFVGSRYIHGVTEKVFYCGCLLHQLNFFIIIWITLLCTVPVNPVVFSVCHHFGHPNSWVSLGQ
jgi:hypothetical protein